MKSLQSSVLWSIPPWQWQRQRQEEELRDIILINNNHDWLSRIQRQRKVTSRLCEHVAACHDRCYRRQLSSSLWMISILLLLSISRATNSMIIQKQEQQKQQRTLIGQDSISCNNQNQLISTCQAFSTFLQSVYGSSSQTIFMNRLIIPCGVCVTIDMSVINSYTFYDGIDIQGRVIIDCHFVMNPQLVQIYTTLLLVQGYFKIDATCQLPIEDNPLVKIIMISKSDNTTSTYTPLDNSVAATCPNAVCNVGEKSITVTGYGQLNWIGISSSTPTWVKLYNVTYDATISTTNPKGIVVPNTVQGQWTVGSLIVITSFTTAYDPSKQQVRTITNINPYAMDPLHYVEIMLNDTIIRPIIQYDNMQYDGDIPLLFFDTSVEVALLTKNIVVTTSEVITKTQTIVGGHLWFYKTYLYQYVYGVDIQYFGQQGILGKYPLHYHFCAADPLNLLAKNTIRYSNQRCIVIHGTDNVTISDNVAYDTFGHCFMVEDGIEQYNQFINNIGIQTKRPQYIIPPNPIMKNGFETDSEPATFWIPNPNNDLINNIAAGSYHTGFWYQPQKRGIMALAYPTINPITTTLGKFQHNVAHSNTANGLRFYPFYSPTDLSIFDTVNIYRNGRGVMIHGSANLQMQNSYVSDNGAGIELQITESPQIKFVNITVVGESNSFRMIVRNNNYDDVCKNSVDYGDFNIGINIGTCKNQLGTPGSLWSHVQFYHYDHTSCQNVIPISMDPSPANSKNCTPIFDHYTDMDSITFHDVTIRSKIDLCRAHTIGSVDDIYITDLHGSLNPYVSTNTAAATTDVVAATVVSLQQTMLRFVDVGKCVAISENCYSYCQDTCFRGIIYGVNPFNTERFVLKICSKTAMNSCIKVPGYVGVYNKNNPDQYRYFPAYLPIGQYNAVFLDGNGVEAWPSFVNQYITDESCSQSSNHTIAMKVPTISYNQCIELIRNGNADASNTEPIYWLSQGPSDLELLPGGGVDGTNALATQNGSGAILVQFLDTRCLDLMKNATYNVYADFQLRQNDGSIYICDPNTDRCPNIGFYTESGNGSYRNFAKVTNASLNSFGFQTITGSIRITDDLSTEDGVRLYIKSYNYNLIVDNVSIKLDGSPKLPNTPGSSCLSSTALIDVKNQGYVPIIHLKIGDYIRSGNGPNDYTQVYGFGHYDDTMEAEFLQIYLFDNENDDHVLEISPNHLLFVQRFVNNNNNTSHTEIKIPANDLMVNDILNTKMVRTIRRAIRRGVYAPLTESGDFQVNGIRVSNYVQILQNPYNMIWDHHLLGHACFLPQRTFCKYFMNICKKERYTNGYGMIASMVVRLGRMINKQGWFVNMIVFIFAIVIIAISFVAETLLAIDLEVFFIALTGAIVIKMFYKLETISNG